MSSIQIHIKIYKAIITMLILVFSLSPCSVKRDILDIFDIQYISGLNKVRATPGLSLQCETSATSSKIVLSKTKIKYKESHGKLNVISKKKSEKNIVFNEYSGHTTGNAPPKYILFKRLKLSLG